MKMRMAGFVLAWLALSSVRIAAARHNILLVIADDLGTDSVALFSKDSKASLPPTPNISSLYESGVLFRNAYSYPTCSPARAAMMTGRYGFRTGIGLTLEDGSSTALPGNELTIPKVMRASGLGYRTASVGKWHLGFKLSDPNTLGGWEHYSGALSCCLPNFFRWPKVTDGVNTTSTNYATSENVNDAISWIDKQGTNNWFLWLAFNAPHDPFHKPPNDLHSYDSLPTTVQKPRPYYEAEIEALDTELGRLLSHLDRSNTTIIFVGDNGTPDEVIQPPYSSGRGKFSLYEGGIRVPMIIAGPTIKNPHRESANLVSVVDLYSTILELAGADLETSLPSDRSVDSRSLLPVLEDRGDSGREWLLSEQFGPNLSNDLTGRAVRDGSFKLIQWKTGTQAFYNLANDPYERTNLLARTLTPDEAAHRIALRTRLEELQNVPHVTEVTYGSNQFSVSVDYVQGVSFSLYRSGALAGNAWQRVSAVVQRKDFRVTLTDRNPVQSASYYRVAAPLR